MNGAPACDCGWMVGDSSHAEACALNQIDWTEVPTDKLMEHYFHPWSHESRVAVRAEVVKRGAVFERRSDRRKQA